MSILETRGVAGNNHNSDMVWIPPSRLPSHLEFGRLVDDNTCRDMVSRLPDPYQERDGYLLSDHMREERTRSKVLDRSHGLQVLPDIAELNGSHSKDNKVLMYDSPMDITDFVRLAEETTPDHGYKPNGILSHYTINPLVLACHFERHLEIYCSIQTFITGQPVGIVARRLAIAGPNSCEFYGCWAVQVGDRIGFVCLKSSNSQKYTLQIMSGLGLVLCSNGIFEGGAITANKHTKSFPLLSQLNMFRALYGADEVKTKDGYIRVPSLVERVQVLGDSLEEDKDKPFRLGAFPQLLGSLTSEGLLTRQQFGECLDLHHQPRIEAHRVPSLFGAKMLVTEGLKKGRGDTAQTTGPALAATDRFYRENKPVLLS